MSDLYKGTTYLEAKRKTNADKFPRGPIVSERHEQEALSVGQTVFNLNFSVATNNANNFVLFVNGAGPLVEGAGKDFEFSSVTNGRSSQVTLTSGVAIGTPVIAMLIGVHSNPFPSPSSVQAQLDNNVRDPNLMALAGFQPFVKKEYVTVPYTQIINRAMMLDPSFTLDAHYGVRRISTETLTKIPDEFGPLGEPVFSLGKDAFNQVRFYGNVLDQSGDTGNLVRLNAEGTVEISFYGTGLNLLLLNDTTSRDIRATVDGGAEGANLYVTGAAVLSSRKYKSNQITAVVSGLTLGLHTIRVRSVGINLFYGFEILSEGSQINLSEGTAYNGTHQRSLASLNSFDPKTNFESGVLGTRGGRVLTYLKADGALGKAVTPAGAVTLTLNSASHVDEDVINTFNIRDFGAERTDDFSSLEGTSNRAFALEDGVTTFTGQAVSVDTLIQAISGVSHSSGNTMSITFIGTGLDIFATNRDGFLRGFNISVDGVSIGTKDSFSQTTYRVEPIVSGLPYGTHTVTLATSQANQSPSIADFIVYGPKKPVLPTNAVELSEYYLSADYSPSVAVTAGIIPNGVYRKNTTREWRYSPGTWVGPAIEAVDLESGFNIRTDTTSAYAEYVFYGTGFEYNSFTQLVAQNWTISVDGSSNLSGFTTSAQFTSTGLTFTAATGSVTGTAGGSQGRCKIRVSGLTLGVHTFRVTLNNASLMYPDSLDVITPIYSPASIGNSAIVDLRKFSPVEASVDFSSYFQEAIIDLAGSNSFTGGSLLVTRSGRQINISALTEIIHPSNNSPGSAAGMLPVWARPLIVKGNVFSIGNLTPIYRVLIHPEGSMGINYRLADLSEVAQTSAGTTLSISYSV